jgi:capsular polysaccharide biosynthesis protein
MLMKRGFVPFEPELYSFAEQISVFASAEKIICLGGSGLFNVCFSAPETKIITIESTHRYLPAHTNLLGSLEMNFGVIIGEEDASDNTDIHKRWMVDLERVEEKVDEFF